MSLRKSRYKGCLLFEWRRTTGCRAASHCSAANRCSTSWALRRWHNCSRIWSNFDSRNTSTKSSSILLTKRGARMRCKTHYITHYMRSLHNAKKPQRERRGGLTARDARVAGGHFVRGAAAVGAAERRRRVAARAVVRVRAVAAVRVVRDARRRRGPGGPVAVHSCGPCVSLMHITSVVVI